jgi:hypothetical protein
MSRYGAAQITAMSVARWLEWPPAFLASRSTFCVGAVPGVLLPLKVCLHLELSAMIKDI